MKRIQKARCPTLTFRLLVSQLLEGHLSERSASSSLRGLWVLVLVVVLLSGLGGLFDLLQVQDALLQQLRLALLLLF